jgi:hypothetical protein
MLDFSAAEIEAVRLSLRIEFWAVVGSLPFGLATAIVLARGRFYGKSLLDGVIHLPFVMPPVVTGYLLLLLFGPHGPLGRFLDESAFPATEATLEVDIEHRLADFALDLHFRAGRGPTPLFGRSGAGKTSVINAIAGLLRPRRGRIAMDGSVLLDTERAICVPTHRRRVGCVFQDGRLFPHLTVRQNLLFGRWLARLGKGASPTSTMSSISSASLHCSIAGPGGSRAAKIIASRSAARCWRARGCC